MSNVSNSISESKTSGFSKKNLIAKLTLSICVNIFTVFTLAFFSPIEVFLGNVNEFLFTFGDIWWILFLCSAGAVILLTLIECLLPVKASVTASLLTFGGGLCCYIQSVLLNGKMGTLTGETDVYGMKTIAVNIIVWLLIFAVILVAYSILAKKGRKLLIRNIIKFVSLALVAMQSAAFVSQAVSVDSSTAAKEWYLSDYGEFELSDKSNVVVFIVDTCDSRYFEGSLDKYPDMLDGFNGFTYYPNTVSTHSRTYPSIPYLLTGEMCYFDLPYNEYIDKAHANSSYLSDISSEGYSVGLYTSKRYLGAANTGNVDNCTYTNRGFVSFPGLIKSMAKISLYRNSPYLLKPRFKYTSNTINESVAVFPDGCIYEDDVKFYSALKERKLSTTESENGAFRFYHFWGAHPGADFDENLNPSSTFDVYAAVRGDMRIIEEYVTQMKNLGVFENSTIIITADHGISSGSSQAKPLVIDSAPCPLLMIKPAGVGDSSGYTVSQAPVCHADIFATVIDAVGGDASKYGKTVYQYSENEHRTRYYYNSALYSDEDGEIALREYAVDGDAKNFENWKLTGNNWDINYSERAVSKHRLSEVLTQD